MKKSIVAILSLLLIFGVSGITSTCFSDQQAVKTQKPKGADLNVKEVQDWISQLEKLRDKMREKNEPRLIKLINQLERIVSQMREVAPTSGVTVALKRQALFYKKRQRAWWKDKYKPFW